METSSQFDTVLPSAVIAHRRRRGPVVASGEEVLQPASPGKYQLIVERTLPDRFPVSSQQSSVHTTSSLPPTAVPPVSPLIAHRHTRNHPQQPSVVTSINPGRTSLSSMEALDPPSSVAPTAGSSFVQSDCSRHQSRPGPGSSVGDRAFQTATHGKYPPSFDVARPDAASTSRSPPAVIPAHGLLIHYQNVGGLNSSLDQYSLAIAGCSYDIIVLTETWLNENTLSQVAFGSFYEVFRCDRCPLNSRKATGGGVLIAVRSGLKACIIENQSWSSVEQVWISLELKSFTLYLCAVYIPPDRVRDDDLINVHLQSVTHISENISASDEMVILGDFNLPGIKWKRANDGFLFPDPLKSCIHTKSNSMLDQYSIASLRQINNITNENGRSLDLCFVSSDTPPSIMQAPSPLVKLVPHHPPILLHLENSPLAEPAVVPLSTYYDFNNADYDSIINVLDGIIWDDVFGTDDADVATATFSNVLSYLIDRHVPKKAFPPSRKVPWQSASLRRLKSEKKAALRRFSKHRSISLRNHYVMLNHRYKKLARRCFLAYQRGVQTKLKRNPKEFWRYINEQRSDNGLPSSISRNGNVANSVSGICRMFSQKFADMFCNDVLLPEQIEAASCNVPISDRCLNAVAVDNSDIVAAASKLKSSKTAGPDGIPSVFLKRCVSSLTTPLSHIFSLSLTTGKFPSLWKEAYIFPVHKKGDRRNADNYRGISTLCAASKLFELVVLEPIFFHVKQYISEDQHGFIPKRSTTTNLLSITSFIMDGFSAGSQTDVVYMDLSAAFDRINHDIAVAKMERLGVGGSLLHWFRSYLCGRNIRTKIGDELSAPFPALSGIPQGSHLGPLIFLLYFNDVNLLLKCHRLSFADDLKIYLHVKTEQDALLLQGDLEIIQGWCERNCMVLNPNKCTVVTFSRKTTQLNFDYSLMGTQLQRVNQVKDLGVILDEKLTFKPHMSYVITKASRNLGFIFRVAKEFRDVYCLKSLYCSLVRSTLEYASPVWNPHFQNGVERLESIQRRFIRYALRRLPWRDPFNLPSYESRCLMIHLDTLQTRREAAKALVIADLLTGRMDCSALLGNVHVQARSRVLRGASFLRVPRRRTNYAANSGLIALQRTFNRVSSVFDFNMSRDSLRRQFLLALS